MVGIRLDNIGPDELSISAEHVSGWYKDSGNPSVRYPYTVTMLIEVSELHDASQMSECDILSRNLSFFTAAWPIILPDKEEAQIGYNYLPMDEKTIDTILALGQVRYLISTAIGVTAYQIIARREQITDVIIQALTWWMEIMRQKWNTRKAEFVEQVESRVSNVYTQLYLLLEYQPIRVLIVKLTHHKGERQFYTATILHEATSGMPSIKAQWQKIRIGQQMTEELIINTAGKESNGGHYVENVENLETGDLKSMFIGYDIRSFVAYQIAYGSNQVVIMLAAFGREQALDEPERARIGLVANNIEKLMYGAGR